MMDKNADMELLNGNGRSKTGMNRREMVQRLMLGASAGIALPAVAVAHPVVKE